MRNSNCWYLDVCDNDCDGCIRYLEMKYLMDSSNIPTNQQIPTILRPAPCDLEAFRTLAHIKDELLNDYVSEGNNIYIASKTTGNGKTSWAIKLMLKYFDNVWAGNGFKCRGIFIHTPTFLLKCKDFNNRDADFDRLKQLLPTVDLVVWDDIASTDISSYDYSQLLMYIDARALNLKANIYTGNLTTMSTLQKALGSKLASRIWAENTEIILFEGADRR